MAVEVQIYIFRPMGNLKGRANHFSPSLHLLAAGQSQPTWQSIFSLFASLLASSRTDHLFFSHHSSSPQSIMRRSHPIYGPLVSGKSFFHHSSFLLNQWILGEINWIFSTPALNFSILIPVLTTTFQLLPLTSEFLS